MEIKAAAPYKAPIPSSSFPPVKALNDANTSGAPFAKASNVTPEHEALNVTFRKRVTQTAAQQRLNTHKRRCTHTPATLCDIPTVSAMPAIVGEKKSSATTPMARNK